MAGASDGASCALRVRLRPPSLASYSARSAAATSASAVHRSRPARTQPTDAVSDSRAPSASNGSAAIARRRPSPIDRSASSDVTTGTTTANSSPPQRATQSYGRTERRIRAAACTSTASPDRCP